MRVFACLALTLMLSLVLPVSAFAEEIWVVDLDSPPVAISEDGSETPVASDTLVESEPVSEPAAEEPSADPFVEEEFPEEIPVEEFWEDDFEEQSQVLSVFSVAALDEVESYAVSDPEEQSMKDVVVTVFGEYSPRTQTVTQYLSDGTVLGETTEIVPGVAGMDWQWISGVALFGLVLYSFLKMVGVLLKNG